jgi:hypothetical protein
VPVKVTDDLIVVCTGFTLLISPVLPRVPATSSYDQCRPHSKQSLQQAETVALPIGEMPPMPVENHPKRLFKNKNGRPRPALKS